MIVSYKLLQIISKQKKENMTITPCKIVGHHNREACAEICRVLTDQRGRQACCVCLEGKPDSGKSLCYAMAVEEAQKETGQRYMIHMWDNAYADYRSPSIGVDAYMGRGGGIVLLADNVHHMLKNDRSMFAALLRTIDSVKASNHVVMQPVRVIVTLDPQEIDSRLLADLHRRCWSVVNMDEHPDAAECLEYWKNALGAAVVEPVEQDVNWGEGVKNAGDQVVLLSGVLGMGLAGQEMTGYDREEDEDGFLIKCRSTKISNRVRGRAVSHRQGDDYKDSEMGEAGDAHPLYLARKMYWKDPTDRSMGAALNEAIIGSTLMTTVSDYADGSGLYYTGVALHDASLACLREYERGKNIRSQTTGLPTTKKTNIKSRQK